VVTIDAMACHPAIAEQIVAQSGDFVLTLKANQKDTLAAVVEHFQRADAAATEFAQHQRHETQEFSH
jgi:predicted transposase YbfD/YdcC